MEGLSSREAQRRLQRFGPNEFDRRKPYNIWRLWLSQFASPLVYILVIAGVMTLWLGEYVDSGVIWAAVAVNTVLGFWQEFKAARSLEALAKVLVAPATVIRDGQRQVIDATGVVPGDVCLVRIGDTIPADGVWWDEDGVFCNEAILTGESAPVEKYDFPNKLKKFDFDQVEGRYKAWGGATVAVGTGKILVVRTGKDAQIGKIAESLGKTREGKTPLQQRLGGLSRTLALIVLGAAGAIVVIGLLRGHGFLEMFETGVAVAVAAVPEGLVVALTVILALGMQRILKRKALVRKLLAAETLGSVSVIGLDKTGTLTEGKMRVTRVDWAEGEKWGYQALVATNDQQNPVEVGVWEWLKAQGADVDKLAADFGRLDAVPFSSVWKYKAALGKSLVFVLGAPDVVINKCQIPNYKLQMWSKKFRNYGSQGYRLVGMAYRHRREGERKLTHEGVEQKLNWLGVVVYEDPVRQSVAKALMAAQAAGVKVKVITGDYRETAVAVLRQLGMKVTEAEIMEGEELERISDQRLAARVGQIRLFARTDPHQKLRIVAALQQNGEVVAMTGDGVNDAPAIKKADIGIVVSEASDVAKETADMVLLDSNFDTIVTAIKEGRIIYETMRKVIVYLLSDSFTELILVAGSLMLGLPLPVTAVQILWVNLVEDSLPSLALAFERNEPGVMTEKPRQRSGPILDAEMKVLIFVIGLTSDLLLLGLFLWLYGKGLPLEEVRTFVFVGLGINSLFYVFSVKTLRRNIWQENLMDNPWLLGAVGVGWLLLLPAVYWPVLQRVLATTPLGLWEWVLLVGLGLVQLTAIETAKWMFLKKRVSLSLIKG